MDIRFIHSPEIDKVDSLVTASGNNVYVIWSDNKTGNWEVMFTRSSDGGNTFEDTVNLSNSSDMRSDMIRTAVNGENVYLTWWETSKDFITNHPVVRVSNDNGVTFGPTLKLAANGTIGG